MGFQRIMTEIGSHPVRSNRFFLQQGKRELGESRSLIDEQKSSFYRTNQKYRENIQSYVVQKFFVSTETCIKLN